MVLYQWTEEAERFEMWWAHRTPCQAHTPTSRFAKCRLRSLLAQTNLFQFIIRLVSHTKAIFIS